MNSKQMKLWFVAALCVSSIAPGTAFAGRHYAPVAKRYMQRMSLANAEGGATGSLRANEYVYLDALPEGILDPDGDGIPMAAGSGGLTQAIAGLLLFLNHGNWCGPLHGSDFCTGCAVDPLDLACCYHDDDWQEASFGSYLSYLLDANSAPNAAADRELCGRMRQLDPSSLSLSATIYRQWAMTFFDCDRFPYLPKLFDDSAQSCRCRLCTPYTFNETYINPYSQDCAGDCPELHPTPR